MKQKTHRLLSLLLCLVMVLGLMPMTAFAEGTREEVDTIKATAIINVPSYDEPTNYPAFTVTEGSPAYIAAMMTHWEKKNTVTGKWDNVSSGNTFTEGTWRLSVQVRIDGEGGKTHKLSEKPRFFVNEVEWQIESKSRFDDYHFVSLAYFHSQEYEVTSSTLPQMYDITVTNGVAKNVSYIDITKAKPGDKVVLLADDRRDEGFAFEKWVVTGATVDAENNSTAKFTMPEGNVTAEATYIPCDISIKAVELTLDNYAVGKKASDISVKIITPDVVDFSYGDTYRCYDEDGVALGGSYVLCYLEGETIKRLGADELIKEGVEYFLEVHIKSDEGYTFLGLKEENVTLDGTAGVAMFMQPNNAVYSFLPKPLKTVDLTLDNYAVGNKAGDISVEITTPGVLFSGSGEGSGEYNQGYQIAIPDGEWIGGTIAVRFLDPDEKLEAGADYDLFVFVKAADGSTLKDLTAANAKLDGKAAEAVDLLSDGVTAVIIFKLTPLEASHTHTYGTEWKSDAYKHWHECSCGAKSKEAAHTAGEWIIDTPATATTSGTKHKECTVCGYTMATETIPATGGGEHTHSYGSEWKNDADNHWHECSCGDKKDLAAHLDANKDHNCDVCGKKMSDHTGGTATCKDKATCTICGQKYGDLAAHNYKTEWSKDKNKHWHECSVCGDKKDVAAHTPGAPATETTPQTCTICGYVIKAALGHTHNFNQKNTSETYLKSAATCTKKAVYYYSCTCGEKGTETFESSDLAAHNYKTEWSKDSTKHWHECSVCGNKKDEAAHTPGAAATETTPQTCTTCGYVIKEAIGHVHSYTEKNTDAKYLKSAATCTAKAVYYYSCSCGEKGTETFESGETLAHTWETKWANNDSKHWHECTVCKTKGDEADHAFEWKIDKEATVTEAGAKHEECKVCGYKKTAIAIDKLAPSIIDGRNAKWNKGGENNMTFKSDAAFSDFVEVLVDGKTITAENYEKREGSIIIELKASYLETLAEGEHTLIIRSASGDATTKFTVEAEIVSPPTGSTNVWVWIIIGVVALGIGAAVDVFIIRKRKTA